MMSINLLPWREYKKLYQQKIIRRIMAATVLITTAIIFCFYALVSHELNLTQQRVLTMQRKIQHLLVSQQVKQVNQPPHVMSLVERLKEEQIIATAVLSELSQPFLHEVCFTDISRQKNIFSFTGRARSALELTDFLMRWKAAQWFSEINIEQLQQQNSFIQFRFRAVEKR